MQQYYHSPSQDKLPLSPPTLWRSLLRASTKSHSCSSSICTTASSWASLKLSARVRPAWKATLALFNRSVHSRGYVFKQGSPSLVLKAQQQQHHQQRVRRADTHLNIPSLTLPSARDAAIPLTSIARLCLDTHVNTGQEASTHWPFLQGVSAAESIQSQSPTGSDCSENPINCSQSGDKLRKVKPNHLKPSHSRKKIFLFPLKTRDPSWFWQNVCIRKSALRLAIVTFAASWTIGPGKDSAGCSSLRLQVISCGHTVHLSLGLVGGWALVQARARRARRAERTAGSARSHYNPSCA